MADRYPGKYSGTVEDAGDPDDLGRVMVSVPAVFGPGVPVPARPALPFGYFFVPDRGTKVWVEFEAGDLGLPLWTGVQCVPGDWPSAATGTQPRHRLLHSPSGHRISLDDDPQAPGIVIEDGANGHLIRMDRNGVTISAGGASITLGSTGITVDAGAKDVVLKGGRIMLGAAASMPVLRSTIDMGTGNLGAPVPLAPGSTSVYA
jgi:hypothetical protein